MPPPASLTNSPRKADSRRRSDLGALINTARSCLDELVADCVADEPGCRRDVELPHRRCPVRLDSLETDGEKIRDLLVRAPLGNELHDRLLARADQCVTRRAFCQ